MPASQPKYKIGDVVRLKGHDTPIMTITGIRYEASYPCICTWFKELEVKNFAIFEDALELVVEKETINET